MRITMARALSSRVGAAVQMRSAIISSSLEKHTASLIFLHGSGNFYRLYMPGCHIFTDVRLGDRAKVMLNVQTLKCPENVDILVCLQDWMKYTF